MQFAWILDQCPAGFSPFVDKARHRRRERFLEEPALCRRQGSSGGRGGGRGRPGAPRPLTGECHGLRWRTLAGVHLPLQALLHALFAALELLSLFVSQHRVHLVADANREQRACRRELAVRHGDVV